jgi:hypothetical protein
MTVDDVVDMLGGTVAFAERYDCSKQQVSNYRARNKLTHRIFERVLKDLRVEHACTAPPELWGIERAA